jgi:hypothetical protein
MIFEILLLDSLISVIEISISSKVWLPASTYRSTAFIASDAKRELYSYAS